MILDTQFTPQLVPLIQHFMAVLGPSWPVVFFTSPDTLEAHFSDPARLPPAWRDAVAARSLHVATIPATTRLSSRADVNAFLSRPWLWERLAPATHVLVFQADSIMCARSPHSIDEFLHYDFIGAPWGPELLFNGGLSLRNRTAMMRVLAERDYAADMRARETGPGPDRSIGEDVWFATSMRAMEGARMPSREQARRFSVEWEAGWYPQPLGYHKVHKAMPARLDEIRKWCPEIDLAMPRYLEGEG